MLVYRARRTPPGDAWRVLILATYGAPDLMGKVFGEGLDQLISKEMKAAMSKGPLDISPGDWGSCQYDSASLVYNMWFEARKVLSFEEALYAFGIRKVGVSYAGLEEAKDTLLKNIEDDVADMEAEDPHGWAKSIETGKGAMVRIRGARTYDVLFEAARNSSWDLWSAVSILDPSLDIDMETVPKPGAMPSWVPILNAMVQEDNYLTGLKCAFAKELGLVKSEDSFKDFDT